MQYFNMETDKTFQETMDKKPRRVLSIDTGYLCNNNCIFCADGLKLGKRSREEIINEIKNNKNIKHAVFAYAEPTLNKNLLEFVKLCYSLRYKTIALSTNGRMLSYNSFLTRLLKSGVNEIIVSVHGHNRMLQEATTRTPGSFGQLKSGLNNIRNARKKIKFRFLVATTVTRINIKHLRKIHDFVMRFKPDGHIFNMVEPRGNAKKRYKALAPTYSEFVAALKELREYSHSLNAAITDIPFCISRDIIDIVGVRERQLSDSKGELCTKNYDSQKRKRSACRKCLYAAVCSGVWKEYIKSYGWGEFRPVENIA